MQEILQKRNELHLAYYQKGLIVVLHARSN